MIKGTRLLGLLSLLLLVACENSQTMEQQTSSAVPVGTTPAEYVKGEALFNVKCVPCHGLGAKGTDQGPPFIAKIYEPNHHNDFSFHRAVQQGVQAHHWKFGNMPKIEGLNEQDVSEIIAYVRWLQRQAGIF
jgi:cytochrome c2